MIFHINYPLKRKHEESNLLHSFPFEPVPPHAVFAPNGLFLMKWKGR